MRRFTVRWNGSADVSRVRFCFSTIFLPMWKQRELAAGMPNGSIQTPILHNKLDHI
jgi:hypothetical protein